MSTGVLLIGALLLSVQALIIWVAITVRPFVRRAWLLVVAPLELAVIASGLGGAYLSRSELAAQLGDLATSHAVVATEFQSVSGDPAVLNLARDSAGAMARPPFDSIAKFEEWQRELRERIQQTIVPVRHLDVAEQPTLTELGTERLDGGIARHALVIDAFDHTKVPAYLFVPTASGPAPAILVLPGHAGDEEASGLAQTAGLVDSYQHSAALELARRGFVTLTLEFRGFGLLGPPDFPEHRAVAHNAILAGSSYKAILARDVKMAADVLLSRAEVDPRMFAIAGASFGAEMAVLYGALDARVAAVAVNSAMPMRGPFVPAAGRRREDQPHYCHTIPGENEVLFQEDWYYLIAPRPLLSVYGARDFNPPGGSLGFLSTPYSVFGFDLNRALVVVPNRGHEFFVKETGDFLARHLGL